MLALVLTLWGDRVRSSPLRPRHRWHGRIDHVGEEGMETLVTDELWGWRDFNLAFVCDSVGTPLS